MSTKTLQSSGREEVLTAVNGPYVDGDYIRNVLVLGRHSINPVDDSNPASPKRNYSRVVNAQEEAVKFNVPSYIMHDHNMQRKHPDADHIGDFVNGRPGHKGIRADFQCLKVKDASGLESYHPQAAAIRDNVLNKRPFGGFSPDTDFQYVPATGEITGFIAVHSIDFVAKPATVASVLEEDETAAEPEYVRRDQHDALESRVKALEEYCAGTRAAATEQVAEVKPPEPSKQRSEPIPTPKITTSAKSFAEYIRS